MFGGGKMKIYIKLFRYFCENKTLKISKKQNYCTIKNVVKYVVYKRKKTF